MSRAETYVLGAPDPEMTRIEEILTDQSLPFLHATQTNGERADCRSAYTADAERTLTLPTQELVLVEAGFANSERTDVIDHHNPGDFGYDALPEDSWRASSLGQLMLRLNLEPTRDDMVLGATDHNFAAAVGGIVPEVDPEEALLHKIEGIVMTHGGTVREVRNQVARCEALIGAGSSVELIAGEPVIDLRKENIGIGVTTEYLAMQTAAAKVGVPVVVRSSNHLGDHEKIILTGNVSKNTVEAFMDHWGPENGLADIYGVPSRGYAGGYIIDHRDSV